MEVKVVNKSKHNLPAYATVGSAGMDIKADIDETLELKPFDRVLVPTGLYIALPVGYEARIQTRSGMAIKSGVIVCNTPGCIDSDYRGEIKVILINLSNETRFIEPGDRVAQMIVSPVAHVEWGEVSELDSTERGEGGFGHTGK